MEKSEDPKLNELAEKVLAFTKVECARLGLQSADAITVLLGVTVSVAEASARPGVDVGATLTHAITCMVERRDPNVPTH
jgi:hypothetical protein